MIQIGLGLLIWLGAVVILMGAGDTLRLPVGDLFPLIGYGGVAGILGIGAVFITHGFYERAKRVRAGLERHKLRRRGVKIAGSIAALIVTLILPLAASAMDLIRVGGFPGGFYFVAQGGLLVLAAIALMTSLRERTIDRQDGADV